jgi:predicted phosphodiesterase
MSGWFPKVSDASDIILCCNYSEKLSSNFIFSLISSKDVRELKEKVGVLPESDGSGKTTSRIISVNGYIIKTDISITFDTEDKARHTLLKLTNLTKRVCFSHPDKIFFILKYCNKFIICSICPELNTIHSIKDVKLKLDALTNILEIGLKAIKIENIQLDLNPSNFGFKDSNFDTLFYLDDEIYASTDLKSIGEYIVCRVKYESSISSENWRKFAQLISPIINTYVYNYMDKNEIILGIKEYPTTKLFEEKIIEIIKVLESELFTRHINELEKSLPKVTKVCIMSDIHSNNYALESVLSEAKKLGATKFVVLGDIVGYGPNPSKTIDILSNLDNSIIIKGNHDEFISKKDFNIGISAVAEESAKYTINVLDEKYLLWLNSLPNFISENDSIYIHASLCGKNYFDGYIYDMTYENNFKEAIKRNIHFVFHGHTHIPYIYIYDQKKEIYIKQAPATLKLEKENKFFLINSGSVGQPRDKDTRASFIILNEDTNEITFHRIKYSFEKVVEDLKKYDLSERLQGRFINGV